MQLSVSIPPASTESSRAAHLAATGALGANDLGLPPPGKFPADDQAPGFAALLGDAGRPAPVPVAAEAPVEASAPGTWTTSPCWLGTGETTGGGIATAGTLAGAAAPAPAVPVAPGPRVTGLTLGRGTSLNQNFEGDASVPSRGAITSETEGNPDTRARQRGGVALSGSGPAVPAGDPAALAAAVVASGAITAPSPAPAAGEATEIREARGGAPIASAPAQPGPAAARANSPATSNGSRSIAASVARPAAREKANAPSGQTPDGLGVAAEVAGSWVSPLPTSAVGNVPPERIEADTARAMSTTESGSPAPWPTLAPRRIASAPDADAVGVESFQAPAGLDAARATASPAPTPPSSESPAAPALTAPAADADWVGSAESSSAGATDSPATETPGPIRFDNSIPTRAEIFAALDGKVLAEKKSPTGASDKTFLSASGKRVATPETILGTGVANSEPAMPAATLAHRPSFVAPLERAADLPVAVAADSPAGLQAAEPATVAHRAVEAVLTAVERFSAGDRHAVQLQFSVGGTDLAVRVELRGTEVRTTFRTDSPELRSALAHEWQAAGAESPDRPGRLAPPVFSANESAAFSQFSGDTTSRQRDARARRAEAEEFFSSVTGRPRSAAAASVAGTGLTAPSTRAAAGTALHLSTLA
jgi:hypothetical protein